jgi:hypothetical protein
LESQQTGERAGGIKAEAAAGVGATARALRQADHQATSNTVALFFGRSDLQSPGEHAAETRGMWLEP